MTRFRPLASVLLLCAATAAPANAQTAAPAAGGDTIGSLARSAEQQLATSVEELNALRAAISAEKLPLAQELTALEEQLAQLRRDHEQVTRLVDAGNLEITTIKAEIKARQDELSYTGNLLDEYARSFESKVNICELQPLGEAIDHAKQAAENTALEMTEKFARQLDFVRLTITRLGDAIGGMRFPGIGVDPQGLVADGEFALIGPVALFRAQTGIAGLVVPQSGSTRPLIRPLEGELQIGLDGLMQSGVGLMPLDPSRGAALKALVQKTNLIHIFEKGGPIMWPLLAASILSLGVVLERFLFLMLERTRQSQGARDRFFKAVQSGHHEGAVAITKETRDYVVRTLGYALEHKEQSLPNALLYAQARELKRFQRGTSVLDTVITLAPLLGLLGTVTGMMGSFSLIGGELSAPGAITGGIAEALIATAFGLGIAITSLIPFNILNTKAENARHELESASAQLELMIQPRATRPPPANDRHTVRDVSQLLVAAGQE